MNRHNWRMTRNLDIWCWTFKKSCPFSTGIYEQQRIRPLINIDCFQIKEGFELHHDMCMWSSCVCFENERNWPRYLNLSENEYIRTADECNFHNLNPSSLKHAWLSSRWHSYKTDHERKRRPREWALIESKQTSGFRGAAIMQRLSDQCEWSISDEIGVPSMIPLAKYASFFVASYPKCCSQAFT